MKTIAQWEKEWWNVTVGRYNMIDIIQLVRRGFLVFGGQCHWNRSVHSSWWFTHRTDEKRRETRARQDKQETEYWSWPALSGDGKRERDRINERQYWMVASTFWSSTSDLLPIVACSNNSSWAFSIHLHIRHRSRDLFHRHSLGHHHRNHGLVLLHNRHLRSLRRRFGIRHHRRRFGIRHHHLLHF